MKLPSFLLHLLFTAYYFVTPVEGYIHLHEFLSRSNHLSRRSSQQFVAPITNGGSQLTFVPNTFPAGLQEPINIIISATSDSDVLVDSLDNGGLQNYFQSIGFNGECLGQHSGDHQQADLGDGHGPLNETAVMRWNYGDPIYGTCKETFLGGLHFRYWKQNGPKADTGAVFMAASYEEPAAQQHAPLFNGYNIGRDELIGNATRLPSAPPTTSFDLSPPPPPPVASTSAVSTTSTTLNSTASFSAISDATSSSSSTATSTVPSTSTLPTLTLPPNITSFSLTSNTYPAAVASILPTFTGRTSANNYTYETTSVYLSGLMSNTSEGINHFQSVANASVNAVDGLVALFQVTIVERPSSNTPNGCSASVQPTYRLPLILSSIAIAFTSQILA